MSLKYSIKVGMYNLLNTPLGRYFLKLLTPLIYVKGMDKQKIFSKKKFFVTLTIDTESGYVLKNSHRVWQKSNPTAYMGYYNGIQNWRRLLNKYNIKATFFLSTNCFSAAGDQYKKSIAQLRLLIKEGHEIGLHAHPDSDLALQKLLGKKFHTTSAKFFSKEETNEIISAGKELIKKHLGISVKSFRWGNWALSTDAVEVLEKNGIKIDSSASPGISGHKNDGMEYDWKKTKMHYPWLLCKTDYQNTKHQDSKVLEIPIATFNFLGKTLRADPVYPILLNSCFDYYYRTADRSEKAFSFVVISHSPESTHKDGTPTKVVRVMEDFIKHAKGFNDVEFVSLENYYNPHFSFFHHVSQKPKNN